MSVEPQLWRIKNGTHEIVVPNLTALRKLIRPGTLRFQSQVYSPIAEGWYPAKHIHEVNARIERANKLRLRSAVAIGAIVICCLMALHAVAVTVQQGYVFLKGGEWPTMSLRDIAAQTLTPASAEILGLPKLSAMYSLRKVFEQKNHRLDAITSTDVRAIYSTSNGEYRELNDLQLWVVAPQSWLGLHKLVMRFLDEVSWPGFVILLVILAGYVAAKINPSWSDWNELER